MKSQKSKVESQKCVNPRSGFTLVEMMVSIGLFTIVLFIATSAFLTIVNTDRKARMVRVAMDNLNLSLEDMQRRVKTGWDYNCVGVSGVADCPSLTPGNIFSFTGQDGTRVIYSYDAVGKSIQREVVGQGVLRVTSPEIVITSLKFVVQGSAVASGDKNQPYVVVLIDGMLSLPGKTALDTTFKIQTTITQRAYDS